MAEQIARIADPPEAGGQIVAAQRQFNTRVRRSLNLVVDILNSLFRRGEIQRIGSWSIFDSERGKELTAALAELGEAVEEQEAVVYELRSHQRALLATWVAIMGFPPPPGIPPEEVAAALSGTP
jgi:hypothetical protein